MRQQHQFRRNGYKYRDRAVEHGEDGGLGIVVLILIDISIGLIKTGIITGTGTFIGSILYYGIKSLFNKNK